MGVTVGSTRSRALFSSAAPAIAIVAVTLVVFPVPLGVAVQGLILGLLGALIAVGMALVYRANRILNFAQGELGTAPTVLAVSLVVYSGWNYFLALGIGIVGSLVLGSLVELAIIRRFFRAPRLILTVATIGLAQLLALGAILIPLIWGKRPTTNLVHVPFTIHFTIEPIVFSADHVVALVVAPLALARHRHAAALHQHRHRHPGQRRALRPGQPARRTGQAAPDRRVGAGRAALVRRGVPPGRHPRPAGHRRR